MMNIDEIIKNVAGDLVRMYHGKSESALVFPRKRDGSIRISEQESKILFSKYFFENNISFAIEAPTMGQYGKSQKSARPDMFTYNDHDAQNVDWMIELKKDPNNDGIRNDFQKMIKEKEKCLWFLTREQSGNISNLLERMGEILKEEIAQHKGTNTWKIAITVLKTGLLYLKEISLNDDTFDSLNIDTFEKNKFLKSEKKEDITSNQLESFPKAGKSMIYAPKINKKTFLHFSWGKGSGFLRDFSLSDTVEPNPEKGRSISEIRKLIEREIEFRMNDPELKNVKYWYNKTIELNGRFISNL